MAPKQNTQQLNLLCTKINSQPCTTDRVARAAKQHKNTRKDGGGKDLPVLVILVTSVRPEEAVSQAAS
jgi:hypothetical protein